MLVRGAALLHRSAIAAQADGCVIRPQGISAAVQSAVEWSYLARSATMLRQRHTAGQAASAVAPAGPTQAVLEAETEVMPKVSPESVIQAKAQQLAALGPAGWLKALVYAAVCVPLWLTSVVQLAVAAVTRPSEVFSTPDPNAFKLQPPFPLHEEYLDVNGIKLHAVSPGRQPGKPLMLMLHGFPECWYSWRHQMTAFAQDYDVVALDMRGYNTSDKPKGVENYMLDVLASDVKGAVAALGHSSCTLVAHDWGGGVAWATAGMYGSDLIKQLIVLGLPHLGISSTNMNPSQYTKSLYIMTFQAPYLPEKVFTMGNANVMYKAFLTAPMGVKNTAAITDQDIDWYRASFCQPGAATATFNYYRGLVKWQLWGDREGPIWRAIRRQLDMPVLVLHGDSDVALGVELLDGIEAVAPKATVKVLKNCSHWIQQDYPVLTNKLLKEWLEQQAQQ